MPLVEQVITGEAASTTTVTVDVSQWTTQPQPGDVVVAAIIPRHTNRLTTGVVGLGLTWTLQGTANPGIWHTLTLATAIVPGGGVTSDDIVATFNGTANQSLALVARVSGGGAVEAPATNFASPASAAVSVALTGVTAGSLVFGAVAHVAQNFTPASPWVGFLLNQAHSTANAKTSMWGGVDATGGSVTVDGSLNNTIEWAAAAIAITEAGGGGPVDLAGTSTTQTSGSGSLPVERPLAGTSSAQTSGSGAVAAERALAGTSATTTSGSGLLDIAGEVVELSGTSTTQTAGSGGLLVGDPRYLIFRRTPQTGAVFDPEVDTPIDTTTDTTYPDAPGVGSYDFQVFATDGLDYSSGSVVAQATVGAPAVELSGTSTTTTSGTGTLGRAVGLSGTSTTTTAGAGSLARMAGLTGTSTITTSGSGSLDIAGTVTLTGTSATLTSGAGALDRSVGVIGTSTITTSGFGVLERSVALSGASATTTSGSGLLLTADSTILLRPYTTALPDLALTTAMPTTATSTNLDDRRSVTDLPPLATVTTEV